MREMPEDDGDANDSMPLSTALVWLLVAALVVGAAIFLGDQ